MSARQRGEGRSDLRTVRDITALEVDHAKESAELAFGSTDGEISFCFDLSLGACTFVIYHVT